MGFRYSEWSEYGINTVHNFGKVFVPLPPSGIAQPPPRPDPPSFRLEAFLQLPHHPDIEARSVVSIRMRDG